MADQTTAAESVYDFQCSAIDGSLRSLSDYAGKVMLIVNTASACGFTPQYKGLQALHEKYAGEGLVVLGFPCNQFGQQEKGSESEISEFCSLNFGVTFPMFAKVDVNGSEADPLFKFLKANAKGLLGSEGIKWNFTKFLIARDGSVIKRYAPTSKPESIASDIQQALRS